MKKAAESLRKGPLDGIRILDLTRVLAGPFCSMILGDLGAEVLKVEEIEKGDSSRAVPPFANGVSHFDMAVNRNKLGLAIDVTTEDGRSVALELAKHCDVLVENFRPSVLDRLGLSLERLREVNPRIIVCSLSGFGKGTSLSNKPSFDIVAQAMSGVMSLNGPSDGDPLKSGLAIGDLVAGMWSVIAILAALNERNMTGRALCADVSMLDSLIALLAHMATSYFISGKDPQRTGATSNMVVPYGSFPAADGHIALALNHGQFWRKFCTAIDHPDWIERPEFRTAQDRRRNRVKVDESICEVLKAKSVEQWSSIFDEADLPYSPVLSVSQALAQLVVKERGLVREVDDPVAGSIRLVSAIPKFDGGFEQPLTPPPSLGRDTAAVLSNLLGYGPARIAELVEKKVIRT